MYKIVLRSYFCMVFCLILIGCSNTKGKEGTKKKSSNSHSKEIQRTSLNISVLLDLSDRINPNKNPKQVNRDKKTILTIEKYFKNYIKSKNVHFLNDKIRVIFKPHPNTEKISQYANNLNINFGKKGVNKKKLFDDLNTIYDKNIDKIYSAAMKQKKFEGSDIWHFMKEDVRRRCIIKKSDYRNILVILTDGYLYWPFGKQKDGNRYNYITGRYKHFNRFRNPNTKLLKTQFDQGDYGFITVQDSLQNLEILVIGVNPPKQHPEDLDIIKKYWSKWFNEMNVKRYEILKTGFPSTTRDEITDFLNK